MSLLACRREGRERAHALGIPSLSARSPGQQPLALVFFLLMLACLLSPRSADASCRQTPVAIVLAASCADGVCTDAMAMRSQVYRMFECVQDTRVVVVSPDENWLPVPEIAKRLGRDVTSGVYEIHTNERCLDDMSGGYSYSRWTDARIREWACNRRYSSSRATTGRKHSNGYNRIGTQRNSPSWSRRCQRSSLARLL